MLELEEETDVVTEIDLLRHRLTELGAKRMEIIEKKRGEDLVCTMELWRSAETESVDENEAILWINADGTFKLFGLLDPDEYSHV